ncbi:hypothetical protein GCM10009846_11800 [Agrococcus versicolor]|uniref:HAD family phosphatase n=1 Tax=Agrococcus versicolor TaxID=501482 RepID=A0ABP5MIY9_9MICO
MTHAVCFDMDGTLVDTEPVWHRSLIAMCAQEGVEWTQADCDQYVGLPMELWIADMRSRGMPGTDDDLRGRAIAMVAEAVGDDVPWLPGARELLSALVDAGVATALVTNAGRANAAAIVRAAPSGSLTVVVTSDDVQQAKPHPEAYLAAAAALGADPARSIGVEDSGAGARAVVAAGMELWFVRSHSPHPGFAPARSVATLAEATADEVLAAFARLR